MGEISFPTDTAIYDNQLIKILNRGYSTFCNRTKMDVVPFATEQSFKCNL